MRKVAGLMVVALSFLTGVVAAGDGPWTITPNRLLKGATGRLVVTLPKGTEFVVYVYRAGAKSPSAGQKYGKAFTLAPGPYDVVINKGGSDMARLWRIRGVPIERGKDTRIHAGVLNVVSAEGMWQVYDENKVVIVVDGSGPEKVGLAAGKYLIKISGEFSPVVIKDGQVTNF
ncbi:MAG: hypothetical protein ACT4PY_05050 [Armatimonadota bacterium]